MGSRALENRIKRLKELEEQAKAIDVQVEALKAEIKADMESKGVDELKVGSFVVRWKEVLTSRFNKKLFEKDHSKLYNAYTKQTSARRFTIA